MRTLLPRRSFLQALTIVPGVGAVASARPSGQAVAADSSASGEFPRTDPELVGRFVGAAHANIEEVRRSVERQPSLARSSWDWGFGDWETPLGAASHMGRRDIAEVLLAHGARSTIFSAAMMGQLEVVRAFVTTSPGVQRTLGPHGITLMAHARVGGDAAAPVVAYLEKVGGADVPPPAAPLAPSERDALVGRYVFGSGARDAFDVDVRNGQLGIVRPGMTRRTLIHTGALAFFPSGVPSVRIAFLRTGARASQLTIADPDLVVTARQERAW